MCLFILIVWLWPLQSNNPVTSRGAFRLPVPRKACQRRWSCARVGVKAAMAAGMMPEHSPVPPEACRGPRVDDQRRTVPTSRRGASRPLGSPLGFRHWWVIGGPPGEGTLGRGGTGEIHPSHTGEGPRGTLLALKYHPSRTWGGSTGGGTPTSVHVRHHSRLTCREGPAGGPPASSTSNHSPHPAATHPDSDQATPFM
jgi:hypothetical protein